MAKATTSEKHSTARVTVDNERVDRLKERHMTTPQEIDNERVRIMAEVYEGTAGYQQIIRRAKFFAELSERKKLYIDENLIVGSIGACVGSYIPYETGHPVEGQPNLGKVLELTLNDGFDPRTKKQLGPKTGDCETFKDFEELYAGFEQQLQFCEDTLRNR